jgi:hypothetical protein
MDSQGRDFERLCAWFLESDTEYATEFEQVWLWNDWPGNWGRDKGIDLVAGKYDGRIVAIQAKQYVSTYYVKKADIDSFPSESSRDAIDQRLLITTGVDTDRWENQREKRHRPIRARTLNPGKSQGRPKDKHGLKAHRRKRPTRLRSPKKAPVPDGRTLGPDPDRPSEKHFHAATSESLGRRGRAIASVWSPTPERTSPRPRYESLARTPPVHTRAPWAPWAPSGCECTECRVVGTEDRLKALPRRFVVARSRTRRQQRNHYCRLLVTGGAVSRRPARFRPPLGPWALRRHRPERSAARLPIASDPHQS